MAICAAHEGIRIRIKLFQVLKIWSSLGTTRTKAIARFQNHPKLKIYSKAFSQNKYPWISQSPKTKIPPKQHTKLLDFIKITPKMTIPLKVKTQDKLLDFRITQK
jgi:hypothetical protein